MQAPPNIFIYCLFNFTEELVQGNDFERKCLWNLYEVNVEYR